MEKSLVPNPTEELLFEDWDTMYIWVTCTVSKADRLSKPKQTDLRLLPVSPHQAPSKQDSPFALQAGGWKYLL